MKPLRVWRAQCLWSVRDLAKEAGVSTKTVIQLEHGRQRPTYRTMRRIADALGTEASSIAEFAEAITAAGTTPPDDQSSRDTEHKG